MKNIFKKILFISFMLSVTTSHAQIISTETKSYGSTGNDFLNDLMEVGNHWYLVGSFQDSIIFDGFPLISEGLQDGFIVCLDSNWNTIWADRIGGKYSDNITSVIHNKSGDIIVSGYFQKKAKVGKTSISGLYFISHFIAKYTSYGNLCWIKKFDKRNWLGNCKIINDENDNIYFTGTFKDTLLIAGRKIPSVGKTDIFLVLCYV